MRTKYLIDTEGCKIPDFSPYDATILDRIDLNSGKEVCRDKYEGIRISQGDGYIDIDHSTVPLKCTYMSIENDGSFGQQVEFSSKIAMKDEFVQMTCYKRDSQSMFQRFFWNLSNVVSL